KRGEPVFEALGRVEERARKKKTKEGDEPRAQESRDRNPSQTPPAAVDLSGLGTGGRQAGSRGGFGSTDGRRANIPGCVSAPGRGRLRRFRFWFGRISFRARHALPPAFLVLENNQRP